MSREQCYFTSFTVTGSGRFPVDMLRYDQCWPVTSEDANKIAASFGDVCEDRKWTIRLTMAARHKLGPTVGRWQSFCVRVSDIAP